jgi:immune inhibitor A
MRLAGVLLIILGLAGSCMAIGPLPRPNLLGQSEAVYFQMRPDIVDSPPVPPAVRHSGTCKALVILVDFDDKVGNHDSHNIMFFRNKLFADSETSMRSYFDENSYGRFAVEGDVVGWFRSACRHDEFVNRDGYSGTLDDYGLDISPAALDPSSCEFPLNVWGLVEHSVMLADPSVDFSGYDNDGPDGIPDSGDDDGYVDALLVVHAGPGAEIFGGMVTGVDYIWSMQSDLDDYGPTRGLAADGVGIGPFVIVPELGEIGVYAHEFCHLLGLPDLYNTETGNPVVGPFCLMDEGAWNGPMGQAGSVPCHLSAPMKHFLGWVEPREVCLGCDGSSEVIGAEIGAHGTSSRPYQVLRNPGGVDWSELGIGTGEYFMIENRQRDFGYFESYLPASGLLIWKVDESRPGNNDLSRQLAEIIQADGETVDPGVPGMNIPGDSSDVWPGSLGKRALTPTTSPSSNLSGNRFSGVSIENITQLAHGTVTADIKVGVPKKGKHYAFPNPYNPDQASSMRIVFIPDPGPDTPYAFSVRIFDLEGNLIRILDSDGEVLGDGTAIWDARDEAGNRMDPGLYFYSVESSGQHATGTIAIQK